VRFLTSLMLFSALVVGNTALVVYMVQSNLWLLGLCMPMIIGYGSALLWTLAFDVYSVCVFGNYEIIGR